MATNILNQAGKGDAPRNNFSQKFRDEHDRIFGVKSRGVCPHGVPIGGKCDACLRAMPREFLGSTGTKRKYKATDLKGS